MPESFISTRNHAWTLVVFLVPYEMEKRKKPSGITINLFVTLESVLFVVGRGCSSIANIFLVLGGLSCWLQILDEFKNIK